MLNVAVLGWCNYACFVIVRLFTCTAKFSEMHLKMSYGKEINIQLMGNSSGRHTCSQHANCKLRRNLLHLGLCAV